MRPRNLRSREPFGVFLVFECLVRRSELRGHFVNGAGWHVLVLDRDSRDGGPQGTCWAGTRKLNKERISASDPETSPEIPVERGLAIVSKRSVRRPRQSPVGQVHQAGVGHVSHEGSGWCSRHGFPLLRDAQRGAKSPNHSQLAVAYWMAY